MVTPLPRTTSSTLSRWVRGDGYRRCRPTFTVGRWPILVAGSTTCSPTLGPGCLNQPTAGTMESPLHGDMHGGFGERPGETDQQ